MVNQSKLDAIGIVSMACRFPGGSTNPEEFWRFLLSKRDARTKIPMDRWDVNTAYPDDCGDEVSYIYPIEDIARFDAQLFNISATEAKAIDPQQRLILTIAYEALYRSNIHGPNATKDTKGLERFAGANVGVFVAMCNYDWTYLRQEDPEDHGSHTCAGAFSSIASGRVSYTFDLKGPSVVYDTGCSSSHVALDAAFKAIRDGDCDSAIVIGCSLNLHPETYTKLQRAGQLSPEGRCHSFDAAADGYARGEGCGAVLLRKSEEAAKDNDRILAILKSVSVSQDGKRLSISATSGPAQQGVIRRGLQKAGVQPNDITFVEAHGSGTPQGDANEVNSLKEVFGGKRDCPLVLGAVKSCVGHLEAAAGMAGLIKSVMVLQYAMSPPNMHLKKLNPSINLDDFSVHFPDNACELSREKKMRVGVSSFGMSGTICFAVLEEASMYVDDDRLVSMPPMVNPKIFEWKRPLSYAQRCNAQAQNSKEEAPLLEIKDQMSKFTTEVVWRHLKQTNLQSLQCCGATLQSFIVVKSSNFDAGLDLVNEKIISSSELMIILDLVGDVDPAMAFSQMVTLSKTIKGAAQYRLQTKTSFVVLTSGSCGPSGTSAIARNSAELAGVWGFAKALRNDLLWLRVRCVDVYPFDCTVDAVVKLLADADKENDLTARNSNVYVPRLRNCSIPNKGTPTFTNRSGTYVVSGGLGGLGLALAEWLVELGAACIILLSRTGKQKPTAAPREVQKLKELEESATKQGYELHLKKCDVTSRELVEALFEEIGEVTGVFHAAGLLNEDSLDEMTEEKFKIVYDCKAKGAWSLHEATKSMKSLKHFVVFSSSAAVLGIPKFVHYCAGNAALDACIAYRRQNGLPGLAIQLSGVSSAGMSFRSIEHQKRTGIFDLQPLEDLRIDFLNLMMENSDRASIFLGMGNWKRYQTIVDNGYTNTILSGIDNITMTPVSKAKTEDTDSRTRLSEEMNSLLGLSRVDRKKRVDMMIQEIVSEVTISGEPVGQNEPLLDAGVDSLAAIELGIKIKRRLPELKPPHMPLPAVLVFQLPTINKIVDHILGLLETFKIPAANESPMEMRQNRISKEMKVLLKLKGYDRKSYLKNFVQNAVSKVTVAGEHVDEDEPLLDAGVDSLAAIELGIILKKQLPELKPPKMPLPAVLVFQLPTVNKIVEHIFNLLEDFTPVIPTREPLPTVVSQEDTKTPALSTNNVNDGENEPIAIIGLACRYPSDNNKDLRTPMELWEFIVNEKIASSEVPEERCWKHSDQYGCFLHGVDEFDAKFFGISPAEAKTMDPQHRLLLEVGYEALYTSGYDRKRLAGMNVGVFVGIQGNAEFAEASGSYRKSSGPYAVSGCLSSYSAGRVSFCLDLTGPCMAIDDACASGLVATHTAVRSIQGGECEMALVEGVSLMFNEKVNLDNLRAGLLSKSGCVCSFDKSATGYHRGEGCGAVVLKKLSAAQRDGDTVLGIIKGSAVKHNGRTASLMAPSISAQSNLLKDALKVARMSPNEVDYLEAHGTATALGDPVEASAIAAIYGQARINSNKRPLFIGSMKANFGHMEAAGSIAGLIKAVLVLHHKIVPANAHLETLNEHIQEIVEGVPMSFPMKNERINLNNKKKDDTGPLGAAVSAFGACGTITHLILQEPPPELSNQACDPKHIGYSRNPVNYAPVKFEMSLGYDNCGSATHDERVSISEVVMQCVSEVIGLPIKEIDDDMSLVDTATLDSLGAIELRNRLIDTLPICGVVNAEVLPSASVLFVKCSTIKGLTEYCISVLELRTEPEITTYSLNSYHSMVKQCADEVLGIACDDDDVLVSIGMDSLGAIELRNNFIDVLQGAGASNLDKIPAPGILFANYPTIGKLTEYFETNFAPSDQKAGAVKLVPKVSKEVTSLLGSSLVRLNQQESKLQLFFLHGIDGDVSSLSELANALPYRSYGISLTPDVKKTAKSLNELATHYTDSVLAASRKSGDEDTEFMLIGYSFGAIIAFEMALVLRSKGIDLKGLVLVDMQVQWPFMAFGSEMKGGAYMSQEIAARKFAGDRWDDKQFVSLLKDDNVDEYAAKIMFHLMPDSMRKSDWWRLLKGWEESIDYLIQITGNHQPSGIFNGPCIMVRSSSPEFEPCVHINKGYCKIPMLVERVSGTHFTMMESPHLQETADVINAFCNSITPEAEQSCRFSEEKNTPLKDILMENCGNKRKVAFMFTGQGSQYVDMGLELYEKEAVFRTTMEQCDLILKNLIPVSLLSVIYGENKELINETRYTQPALFSVEYSLAMLWKSRGLVPHVVMGHSVGEYVAATIAGVLTLEDGLRLIAARGEAIGACDPQDGVMVAVRSSKDVLINAMNQVARNQSIADRVAIASVNGPKSCVLAGERALVNCVVDALPDGVGTVHLKVSHAFHSPLVKGSLRTFRNVFQHVTLRSPKLPIVSNLTTQVIYDAITRPKHWEDHILGCVNFSGGIKYMIDNGVDTFVEIGAHPTLSSLGKQIAIDQLGKSKEAEKLLWVSSMQRGKSNSDVLNNTERILKENGIVMEIKGGAPTDFPVSTHLHAGSSDGAPGKTAIPNTTDSFEDSLLGLIEGLLDCTPEIGDDLCDLGLDSLAAIELQGAISSKFGVDLPSGIMFYKPLTVRHLSNAVAKAKTSTKEINTDTSSDDGVVDKIPTASSIEEKLVKIMQELLDCRIGKDDDLGDAGLDSLIGIELEGIISSEFGTRLPTSIMFYEPLTIATISSAISEAMQSMESENNDKEDLETESPQHNTNQSPSRKERSIHTSKEKSVHFEPSKRTLRRVEEHLDSLYNELMDPATLMDRLEERLLDRILARRPGSKREVEYENIAWESEPLYDEKRKISTCLSSVSSTLSSNPTISLTALKEGRGHVLLLEGQDTIGCKSNLFSYLKSHHEFLSQELRVRGGLLIRSCGLHDAKDFRDVLKLFQDDDKGTRDYRDGISPRSKVLDGIFTSTEYSAKYDMALHNEMSYNRDPPSKIAFFCETAPPKGTGRTPIASSEEILKKLPKHIVSEYKKRGVSYIVNAPSKGKGPGVPWETMYETSDRREVDECCKEMGIKTRWNANGSLTTFRNAPAIRCHPETKREVWFNHSHLFHPTDLPPKTQEALRRLHRSRDEYPKYCMFADGEEIPTEFLDKIRATQKECSMSWDWQNGDLLLLDNFVLCHGRTLFDPEAQPKRRILASMLF